MRRRGKRGTQFLSSLSATLSATGLVLASGVASAQALPGPGGGSMVNSATPSYSDRLQPGSIVDAEPVMGTEFHGMVGLTGHYTDNIDLADDSGTKRSEQIVEVTPGFTFTHGSPRVRANLGYEFHSYNYVQDSDLNQAFHRANLGAAWQAVPQWFSVGTQATYGQRVVNPERSLNFNDLFSATELTDQTTASVTPALVHDFSGITLDSSYTFGKVNYSGAYDPSSNIDDSTRHGYHIEVRPTQTVEGQSINWSVGFNAERVDYDHSFPYNYKQAIAGIGVPISRRIELLADAGVESDLTKSVDDGKLDSEFWSAGFRLNGDARTQLQLKVGHRFFGKTYEAKIGRTARMLRFAASYTEQPQTENERLTSFSSVNPPLDGVLPPSGAAPVRPIAQPYVLKLFDSTVSLEGRLTSITLGVFSFKQQYLVLDQGEKDRGVRFVAMRRLGPRMSATLAIAHIETYFAENTNGQNNDDTVSIGLARQLTKAISFTARALYLRRTGPAAGDYDAKVATVGLVAAF